MGEARSRSSRVGRRAFWELTHRGEFGCVVGGRRALVKGGHCWLVILGFGWSLERREDGGGRAGHPHRHLAHSVFIHLSTLSFEQPLAARSPLSRARQWATYSSADQRKFNSNLRPFRPFPSPSYPLRAQRTATLLAETQVCDQSTADAQQASFKLFQRFFCHRSESVAGAVRSSALG